MTVTINGNGPGNWDSSGNLGIGTSSPSAKLDVSGATWVRGGQKVAGYLNPLVGDGYNVTFGISSNTGYIQSYNGTATNALSIDGSSISFRTGTFTTAATIDSSGNLQFNSGYGSVATAYGCRAWVNFNGTGTVAIRGSGNVSSITDNGTGDYTVNFTNAMPDVNYSLSGTSGTGTSTTSGNNRIVINAGQTTGGQRLNIQRTDTGTMDDIAYNNIAIFR